MDRKISDEQLDRIAKDLLKDFALDDETLEEIAASPKLWWSVRNRIEAEKTRREKSWLAAFSWQIPVFGALAIVICFGLTVLFLSSNNNVDQPIAKENPIQNPAEEKAETPQDLAIGSPNDNSNLSQKSNPVPEKVSVKNAAPKAKLAARNQMRETSAKQPARSSKKPGLRNTTEEIKTDFIALSYGSTTESGQIVKVKVPRSLMASLGVATNIEKNTELVNAEVIVGDDGLARAIRFVQ